MSLKTLLGFLAAVSISFAKEPQLEVRSIVALEKVSMCSVYLLQDKKHHWVREGEAIPGHGSIVIQAINPKGRWVRIKYGDELRLFTPYLTKSSSAAKTTITPEEAGLSQMVKVFEQKEKAKKRAK